MPLETNPSDPKPTFWQRLQQRWGVSSVWQVLAILLAFALAGSSIVWLKKGVYNLLGIHQPTWWQSTLYYLLIFPVYQVFLLCYGVLLGQRRFFLPRIASLWRAIGKFLGIK